jgi:diguanylate cyclase (GGDEF)-like protein
MRTVLSHFTIDPGDPADVRFFQRAQLIGVALTAACCAFIATYLVWTWSQPNRPAMLAMAAGCTIASAALLVVPSHVKRRRRNAFFVTSSGAIIVIVAIFIALDGGLDDSPLVVVAFLPLIYATAAYPPLPMLMVAGAIVVTFVAMGIAEGDAPQSTFLLGCTLTAAAVMCATISRLHHRQRGELARVSRADPLTDCLNRRGLQERLEAELAGAGRHDQGVALIVIDLDAFKAVNDRDGHAAGDALLVWTVQQIVASVRPLDAVGRMGGDEFAVVLPATGPEEALEVACRIELALAARTPASTGVAAYPVDGRTAEALHAYADARLYDAKRGVARILAVS